VERKTRQKKRVFYGCSNYPTCNFAIWERPVPDLCPNCGGLMVIPKVGQDPVCYQEVIVAQRGAEEQPQQTGEKKTRRSTRSAAEGSTTKTTHRATRSAARGTATKTTRRTSTRKRAADQEIVISGENGPGSAQRASKARKNPAHATAAGKNGIASTKTTKKHVSATSAAKVGKEVSLEKTTTTRSSRAKAAK
jgi:DNA topoisomerase-1